MRTRIQEINFGDCVDRLHARQLHRRSPPLIVPSALREIPETNKPCGLGCNPQELTSNVSHAIKRARVSEFTFNRPGRANDSYEGFSLGEPFAPVVRCNPSKTVPRSTIQERNALGNERSPCVGRAFPR